jgi:hypothetical protein
MHREHPWNGGADRVTRHINRRPGVNIHHATRYSDVVGLPLNRFVTVNFTLTECSPDRASHTFRKLLTQRFAPWLRRTASNADGVRPTYVWTLEAGGKQLAAHWLVHVPNGLHRAFERKLAEWLRSLTGAAPENRAVNVRSVTNLIGARRYLLKGIDPAWANHLRIRHVDQGIVIGKRSGFSRNLGPCARTRGGYRPKRVPFTLPTQ